MNVKVYDRHVYLEGRLSTNSPDALAIKEELDKEPIPAGYIRVDRVVSATSSIFVTEHRIIQRKGREEVDLFFRQYFYGSKTEVNLNETIFQYKMIWSACPPLGGGEGPTPDRLYCEFEITRDPTYKERM